MKVDISIWNLAVPLAVLAACSSANDEHDTGDEQDYFDSYDCGEICCEGECPFPPYGCSTDSECAPGYVCEQQMCAPALPPPSECGDGPAIASIVLRESERPLAALAFIDATPTNGRELLIATETTIELVQRDGVLANVATTSATQLAVADLDGDGDEDFAALEPGIDASTVRVYLSDGAGGWTPGSSITAVGPLLDFGDLDGDGIVDLVGSGFDRARWRRGVGDGSFAADDMPVYDGFNDGAIVLGAVGASEPAEVIVFGTGLLSYAPGATLALQPLEPQVSASWAAIASGDFDGDGVTDVSIATTSSSLMVHTWRDIALSPTALTPWSLEITNARADAGDLDGDGLDDLVLASGDGALVFRFGTATNTGDPLGCYVRGHVPGEWIALLAVGDLDGDGRAEVVSTDGFAIWSSRLQ
ncbi:MAG TPA: VCBS repeat-containing protein [Nannocystaceae bacterium]|nr:VCBS repeat-containing protein [Nannocystaceae bacterium]